MSPQEFGASTHVNRFTNRLLLSMVTTSAIEVEQKAMKAGRRSSQCQIKCSRKPIEQCRHLSSDSLKNGTCNLVQQPRRLCPQSQVFRGDSYLEFAAPLQPGFCIPLNYSQYYYHRNKLEAKKLRRHFLRGGKKVIIVGKMLWRPCDLIKSDE